MEIQWLEWAKELQSIGQAGLTYSKDKFDLERFQRIRDLSVEIISKYTDMSHEKVKDLFANEVGYQTPKVDVRAAIFKDNKILLVKEQIDGKWSMPGGWAEPNLSVKENLMKEAMEEAGAVIEPIKIIAIHDRKKHIDDKAFPYGVYKIFVQCEFKESLFQKNTETEDAKFFALEELPSLSEGRNTKEQVEMCFSSLKNNFIRSIFD